MLKKRNYFESVEAGTNVLKEAISSIIDEWNLVSRDFTLIDKDEIEAAVDLINSNINSISKDELSEIANTLEDNSDFDVFDDIYVENNKLVFDCFILNSVLSREERIALAFNKGAVQIKAVRENGRDLIRITISL